MREMTQVLIKHSTFKKEKKKNIYVKKPTRTKHDCFLTEHCLRCNTLLSCTAPNQFQSTVANTHSHTHTHTAESVTNKTKHMTNKTVTALQHIFLLAETVTNLHVAERNFLPADTEGQKGSNRKAGMMNT